MDVHFLFPFWYAPSEILPQINTEGYFWITVNCSVSLYNGSYHVTNHPQADLLYTHARCIVASNQLVVKLPEGSVGFKASGYVMRMLNTLSYNIEDHQIETMFDESLIEERYAAKFNKDRSYYHTFKPSCPIMNALVFARKKPCANC